MNEVYRFGLIMIFSVVYIAFTLLWATLICGDDRDFSWLLAWIVGCVMFVFVCCLWMNASGMSIVVNMQTETELVAEISK